MTITTLDGYIASAKQVITFLKTAGRTTAAGIWYSVFELAGNPGNGVLAGTNTAAGVVPTDLTAGTPFINAYGGGATGYLTKLQFGAQVSCRLMLCDLLFKAGAYAFNAAVTLAAQPSYASRVPSGTDFKGLRIFIEAVTVFTGTPSFAITYTNQDGVAGRTTGVLSAGVALNLGRMLEMPLQAGDTGVRTIESVTATVATVGTFNVLVIRPLWTGRVPVANSGDNHSLDITGMPQVFVDSALMLMVAADGGTLGNPELLIEIANG